MSILIEKGDRTVLLSVEGELNIAEALELKAQLVGALNLGEEIHVDLRQTADLDITALQLLHTAHRDSVQSVPKFVIENVPEHIAALIAEAGFTTL